MKPLLCSLSLLSCLTLAAALSAAPQEKGMGNQTDWIDATTGHRIIRLSSGDGSSLYFHDNTYTPEGDKFIYNSKAGIVVVNLKTLGTQPVDSKVIVPGASAIGMAR
ncbi:MAG TPA: hypothetical protein VE988_11995, partial [Gemmataceae bacterium]|nr:hypothetical protein [Gemmataceae bacterium]